jgi:hypothetical protein
LTITYCVPGHKLLVAALTSVASLTLVGYESARGQSTTKTAHPAVTYRVLVDTDLGGDPDDIQSLFRLVQYSDILKVEGIVSSPGPGAKPSTELIRNWIRRVDVDHLRRRGHRQLMPEAKLLDLVKAGSAGPGPPTAARSSDGSRSIIKAARAGLARGDKRPLWVLIWGSMTTVAQALHDDPSIAASIRIYSIGSSNTRADPASRDDVFEFMQRRDPKLWWIENGIMPWRSRDTFRGVYQGGDQTGEWGNRAFIVRNIRGHGSNHQGLFDAKCGDAFPVAQAPSDTLKEGDSPSLLYLLSPVRGGVGNVDDPTVESWGGQFRKCDGRRYPHYYVDAFDSAPACQATISKWRKAYLRDWKARWDWY